MKRIPKSIQKEVSEVSGTDVKVLEPQTETQVVEISTAKQNGEAVNLTESRKVKKVAYEVTFPNPEKTTLSAEQTARAVNAFFKARVGYLLRENVKKEQPTIEAYRKTYEMSLRMVSKLIPDAEAAKTYVLTDLKESDPNFRLEPTKSFVLSLDEIFKSDETEEDEEEKETSPETPAAQ